jgi:NADH dehydrogenase
MTEHNTRHKVVVIGGGYAGTLAANDLRMRAGVDITLVNPRPDFVGRVADTPPSGCPGTASPCSKLTW